MARKIAGIIGIGLWAGLIVLLAVLQTKANGNENMFKNLPEGWNVEKSFLVTKEQTAAISDKLGGKISKLTNTILSFKGQQLQVNVIYCPSSEQAEKIYMAVLQAHDGIADYALLDNNTVVEFAKCNDANLARKARQALGLELARLNNVSKKLIRKLPAEWQVIDSFIAPVDQTDAIGKKLGGHIKNLSNTIFSVQAKQFQVNIIECMTLQDAEKIYESTIQMKKDPALCLKCGNYVVEFVSDDIELAKQSVFALGIKSMPIETLAKDLVDSLASGDFNKAVENFDDTMKTALPADKLQQVWNSLIVQCGAFIEQKGTRTTKIMGYDVVFVTCKFEKAVLDTKVVFNDKQQVTGLFFVPAK